jgi:peptidoglycan-N-acetylglucosamine deacetylase
VTPGLAGSATLGIALAAVLVLALPRLGAELAGRTLSGAVFSVEMEERVVALSIDDGPSAATPELLEILDAHGARATFFVLGEEVERNPELAEAILAGGHELGHHMMEDVPSRGLPPAVFEERFDRMHALLEDYGGATLFRPGSGWYDQRMLRVSEARGYRTVLGSVYPFDAHLPFPALLSRIVLAATGPGAILILHEGQGRGERTAEVLRTVLPELVRRGYRVVSVSELLGKGGVPAPPQVH